jgi:hypothetical protein
MKTYNVSVKNIYTNDERLITLDCNQTTDVRIIHKDVMKNINMEEDITSIQTDNTTVYSISKGFIG